MPEEGRLAPPGVPRAEDLDPEELQQSDADGDRCPENEPTKDDRQVAGPPHEQRHCHREEPVLDELEKADEVVGEQRVVDGYGSKGLEREPCEESGTRDPEEPSGGEAGDSHSRRRDGGHDEDDHDCEIGEPHVDGRRADADADLGLIALVREEEWKRRREHEGTDCIALDQAPKARRRAHAVERLGRHRATIGRRLPGSIRGVASIH